MKYGFSADTASADSYEFDMYSLSRLRERVGVRAVLLLVWLLLWVCLQRLGGYTDGQFFVTPKSRSPKQRRCRVPDDWLLKNKCPLLHGREVLREVLATWQARAKELPR